MIGSDTAHGILEGDDVAFSEGMLMTSQIHFIRVIDYSYSWLDLLDSWVTPCNLSYRLKVAVCVSTVSHDCEWNGSDGNIAFWRWRTRERVCRFTQTKRVEPVKCGYIIRHWLYHSARTPWCVPRLNLRMATFTVDPNWSLERIHDSHKHISVQATDIETGPCSVHSYRV